MSRAKKNLYIAVAAGFVAGTIGLVAIRFFTIKDEHIHYHANFALYVNGERDKLDNFTFYEEVQSCGSDEVDNPRTRVHLHDKTNHVVHVHDTAATWGQLFANLGYALGDNLVKTDKDVFVDGQDNELRFLLNGKEVAGIANATISSEDVLLIDYGNDDKTILANRYDAIPQDAAEYNRRDDPSTCKGDESLTFTERLKKAVGF